MKAVTYQGVKNVVVKDVPDPKIEKHDDMIIKVTSTAICGSDLHLIHGLIPNLQEDYIIGHEPMGIVEETDPGVTKVKKATASLFLLISPAENALIVKITWKANVINQMKTAIWALISAIQGVPHGYPGGQAEYLRVPLRTLPILKSPKHAKNRMRN